MNDLNHVFQMYTEKPLCELKPVGSNWVKMSARREDRKNCPTCLSTVLGWWGIDR